jgi:hypothetical protein
VASLPANLLGVPVAGLVMVWGLTGGLVAGLVTGPGAALLHVPTGVALWWLELVADRTARAPLGELHAEHLVALAVGLAGLTSRRPRWRVAAGALAVAAVLAAVVTANAPVARREALRPGVVRWHGPGVDVVVLGGGGRSSLGGAGVLESLRRAGVGTIDLLVVADGSVPETVVELVARAHRLGQVHELVDGAGRVEVGSLVVRIVAVPGRLVVDAGPRGP